jgi:hypothetical protein
MPGPGRRPANREPPSRSTVGRSPVRSVVRTVTSAPREAPPSYFLYVGLDSTEVRQVARGHHGDAKGSHDP